jgi:beta-mannosidase
MARIIAAENRRTIPLATGWELLSTAAQQCAAPPDTDALQGWLPAQVPGTVAAALQTAGLWNLENPAPLHDRDHWYRLRFNGTGHRRLRFHGLATIAEIWLNGELILQSDNMFVAHDIDVELRGDNALYLCFRALAPLLAKAGRRARWRPAMITPGTLRSVRTTVLGHMPGWCPPVHAVGPWRAVEILETQKAANVTEADVRSTLRQGNTGELNVRLAVSGAHRIAATLECAGRSAPLTAVDDQHLEGHLDIPDVAPWWPHTHGEPKLYAVRARLGDTTVDLGRIGFRRIEVDRGSDGRGFSLIINGTPVFCRGACWAPADIVGLPDTREACAPWLELMKAANMNMVRVGGTMVYEGDAFYELCDELGLLVWQDFMFANFDYPVGDKAFESGVRQEAAQFLKRVQTSPALAVLCGGSEVAQQASMLGLPREAWSGPLFDEWLPNLAAEQRPDVPYVPNSPSGGELPFIANTGVTHYYGVGAYLRPLDDARRAEVRFASECLAFANVPEARTLSAALPVPALHHPLWKQRVPRDQGASWDFEDIRDHYLAVLYAVDPALLRREEPERYLELSRAVTGEVMEAVFAEWRRTRSPTAGGLVWLFKDLWPGAGWGVVDALGEPKAPWYALRRAFRPLQVALTDEGVNGLAVHVINDTQKEHALRLSLTCWRGSARVVNGERPLQLGPRSTAEVSSTDLFGAFFDATYAYRFGPPAHEMTHAALHCAASGALLAEAFHFPRGRAAVGQSPEIRAELEHEGNGWFLKLSANRPALSLHVDDPHFRPDDNWFHLAPGGERRVRLLPRTGAAEAKPDGEIRILNGSQVFRYRIH